MFALYDFILYTPLLNALVFLYETVAFHDFGVAVILLTIALRVLLFPLFESGIRYQAVMQRLQPELQKIKTQAKGDKEREVREQMELFRVNHVSPFSGFVSIVLQALIFITLFHILRTYADHVPGKLYEFIALRGDLNEFFLGLINLAEPSILLVGIAALAQFFQAKWALPPKKAGAEDGGVASKIGEQMIYVGPVILLIFFSSLPAAIPLYFLTSTFFSIIQQKAATRAFDDTTMGTIHQHRT